VRLRQLKESCRRPDDLCAARINRISHVLATVQFFEVVLAVHIMAVVFAFGATFAYPVLLGTVGKADSRALPALYRAIHAISVKVIMPGLAIVVICGIYLASKLHVWSEFYVQWGIAVAVVIGAVEGMFLSPNEKRLIEVAEKDLVAAGEGTVTFGTEHDTLVRRIGAVGATMDLLVILTILFMALKT
jgi:hypothetical protein